MMLPMRTEKQHIIEAVKAGRAHGYGNVIDRLKMAWAHDLVANHGMDVEQAMTGALMGNDPARIRRCEALGREGFLKASAEHAMLPPCHGCRHEDGKTGLCPKGAQVMAEVIGRCAKRNSI
jgi:hypothetical protein